MSLNLHKGLTYYSLSFMSQFITLLEISLEHIKVEVALRAALVWIPKLCQAEKEATNTSTKHCSAEVQRTKLSINNKCKTYLVQNN